MPCDEYKKLDLLHQYAIERILRFAKPDEEPQLEYLTVISWRRNLTKPGPKRLRLALPFMNTLRDARNAINPQMGSKCIILNETDWKIGHGRISL